MAAPIVPSTIEHLLAIEEIKRVKATYWYSIDTKDWAGLASVFTPDASFDARFEAAAAAGDTRAQFPEAVGGEEGVVVGGPEIAGFLEQIAQDWVTVHHGHAPIIGLTGEDTARGIWPFFDILDSGEVGLYGYLHYHEHYLRHEDRWLIHRLVLKRLRLDGPHPAFTN